MKRVLLAAILGIAMLSLLPVAAGPAGAVVASPTPRILSCTNKGVLRPSKYTITCADGYTRWSKAKWKRWGETTATATGIFFENDCTPNCATGHEHHYAATIALSKPVKTKKHGRLFSVALIKWKEKGKKEHERFSLYT